MEESVKVANESKKALAVEKASHEKKVKLLKRSEQNSQALLHQVQMLKSKTRIPLPTPVVSDPMVSQSGISISDSHAFDQVTQDLAMHLSGDSAVSASSQSLKTLKEHFGRETEFLNTVRRKEHGILLLQSLKCLSKICTQLESVERQT